MGSLFKKIIKLKSGKEVFLRFPKLIDAKAFSDYINELVEEDTFISSRKQTVEEEKGYIKSMLKKITDNKEIHIVAFDGEKKIGSVDIFNLGVRKEHLGELQINILKSFRRQGLGKILIDEAIKLAKEKLNLKLIILTCFSVNNVAKELYLKKGFKQYGLLPKAIKYKNQYINEIQMYKEI